MVRQKTPAPPLNAPALERLALRYVERFATTRAKLATYLRRKLRERGWADESAPPVDALVERFADLGYVDDRAWGEAKASAMARHGLGARRVKQALDHAGVVGADAAEIEPAVTARELESAVSFARHKRIGPFAREEGDRAQIERQIGQLARAGHSLDLSRRIARMTPLDPSDFDDLSTMEDELIRSLS